jgi:hypothetical protein
LFLLQIFDNGPSIEVRQVGGSTEIHPDELMAPWVYDEKFLVGMQFLLGTLPFMVGEGDNLELPAQEQEGRRMTTTSFKFPRGLKNSAIMLQQQAMTNRIDD